MSINQILQQFNGEEDMSLVVAGMARICKEGNWSKALLSTLNAWWRDYTHSQSLLQLQRLEREMDTQRPPGSAETDLEDGAGHAPLGA